MPDFYTTESVHTRNLSAAAADWKKASTSLADSARSSSEAVIEKNYAWFRAAKAEFMIALRTNRVHIADSNPDDLTPDDLNPDRDIPAQ